MEYWFDFPFLNKVIKDESWKKEEYVLTAKNDSMEQRMQLVVVNKNHLNFRIEIKEVLKRADIR